MAKKEEKIIFHLPYLFKIRDYQRPLFQFLDSGYRRACVVWHRRAGKDITLLNFLISQAATVVGAYYYFYPTYHQARMAIWEGRTNPVALRPGEQTSFPFMGHIPEKLRLRTNSTELMVELWNGSIIRLIGSDKIDSIMGTNPVGCVFSEYSLQNPVGWDYVSPILLGNGGWAIFNFTPRGHNHAFALWNMARKNPLWFTQMLTILDTGGVFTEDQVQSQRDEGKPEEFLQQEYYCSFDVAIPGAFWGRELTAVRQGGRIKDFDIDRSIPVDTYWDLGISATAIWFVQHTATEHLVVDYFEDGGSGFGYYADILEKRGYRYGTHFAPHDIGHREISSGKTRKETAFSAGIRFKEVPRIGNKQDSIEAARGVFPRCTYHESNCERGLAALSSYHREWSEERATFNSTPAHDWASHGADAFQQFAMSVETGDLFPNREATGLGSAWNLERMFGA